MFWDLIKEKRKKKFYDKIEPYIREGMIRVVYEGTDFCIISVGEMFYAACPYSLLKNQTHNDKIAIGLTVSDSDLLRKFINDERFFITCLKQIFEEYGKYNKSVCTFSEGTVNRWKEWIEKKKANNFSARLDEEFEKEVAGIIKTR